MQLEQLRPARRDPGTVGACACANNTIGSLSDVSLLPRVARVERQKNVATLELAAPAPAQRATRMRPNARAFRYPRVCLRSHPWIPPGLAWILWVFPWTFTCSPWIYLPLNPETWSQCFPSQRSLGPTSWDPPLGLTTGLTPGLTPAPTPGTHPWDPPVDPPLSPPWTPPLDHCGKACLCSLTSLRTKLSGGDAITSPPCGRQR